MVLYVSLELLYLKKILYYFAVTENKLSVIKSWDEIVAISVINYEGNVYYLQAGVMV